MSVLTSALVIIVAALLTSILSGFMGMAGGVILIAVLVVLLPVPSAMILHGILQGVANGSRSWILREHIVREVLLPYLIGAILVVLLFGWAAIVVDASIILIVVGCFPWISQFLPKRIGLDVTKTPVTFICGGLVTTAQLLAGASGPLLDAFYQKSPLSRYQIVATKAFTQTIGHIFKVLYFTYVLIAENRFEDINLTWWVIVLAVMASITGTRLGTLLLDRISDTKFRQITNIVILAIGTIVIARGVYQLLSQ